MRTLSLAIGSWLLLFGPMAHAETYYVDVGGSDGASGTQGAPWATLQHAADVVTAGDVVIVRAGDYAGFHLETSGTSDQPITFRGEANAVVNVDNSTTPDGINLEGASYVVVEGFTVTGVTRAGIRAVLCEHVTIRNNRADMNGRWGILTGFCDDLLIENNECSRSGIEHGIYVSNSGDRPVVRGNRLWGNNANGLHMNGDVSLGGDGVISNALVENNIIWDNGGAGGSGINGDGVQDSVIRNNLLYGNHASGISLYQIDGGAPATGNLIINNTIVQASDGRWAVNIQDASINNRVINNILLTRHAFRGIIDISGDSLPGFVSDYNVVIGRFTNDGGNSTFDLAEWQADTGQDQNSIEATIAEVFEDEADDDYHLSATSPALERGTATEAPSADFEGQARPMGSGIDIGADEFCPDPCTAPTDAGVPIVDSGTPTDSGAPSDAAIAPDVFVGSDLPNDADWTLATDAGVQDPRDASSTTADSGPDAVDEGCGCAVAETKSGSSAWLAAAVFAFALIRRPRGRHRRPPRADMPAA